MRSVRMASPWANLGALCAPSNIVTILKTVVKVLPELAADVKVFIGVYQTMANMGSTLSVKFPDDVEAYLDGYRSRPCER